MEETTRNQLRDVFSKNAFEHLKVQVNGNEHALTDLFEHIVSENHGVFKLCFSPAKGKEDLTRQINRTDLFNLLHPVFYGLLREHFKKNEFEHYHNFHKSAEDLEFEVVTKRSQRPDQRRR